MNGIQDYRKSESVQNANQPILIKKKRIAHNRIDLDKQKFGRLTVMAFAGTKNKRATWLCKCDRGNKIITNGADLRSGHTQSCGCLKRDRSSAAHKKHGLSKTAFHTMWTQMKKRCANPKDIAFKNYGGRGIKVCNRWLDFINFWDDMYEKYLRHRKNHKHTTIERKKNNGNYEPNNCIWATQKEQSRNTRHNRTITYKGKTLCAHDWAKELGIIYTTLIYRLNKYPPEIAFNMHQRNYNLKQVKEL